MTEEFPDPLSSPLAGEVSAVGPDQDCSGCNFFGSVPTKKECSHADAVPAAHLNAAMIHRCSRTLRILEFQVWPERLTTM